MIDAFTLETGYHLGDALGSMHRLRHRVFVERQKYDVPTYRSMEWDQFDTPAAAYLVWRDEEGEARAVTRLIPTTLPYMIKELWADLVEEKTLPSAERVWEASRLGIDRGLDPDTRREVLGELVCGCLEYGLRNNIDEFLCVMPIQMIDGAIRAAGIGVHVLGEPKKLGGLPVVAGRVHISRHALVGARRFYGIKNSVLNVAGERPIPATITNPPLSAKQSLSAAREAAAVTVDIEKPVTNATAGADLGPALSPKPNTAPAPVDGPSGRGHTAQPDLLAATSDEPERGWPVPFPPPPYAFPRSLLASDI